MCFTHFRWLNQIVKKSCLMADGFNIFYRLWVFTSVLLTFHRFTNQHLTALNICVFSK